MKPLNSGHLRVLKNLSVIERFSLLGGSLRKIIVFGTHCIVRCSWHVHYLGCPLLGVFTVTIILLEFIRAMSEKSIENITKSDSNFASTFVDHHVLLDIRFSGYKIGFNSRSEFSFTDGSGGKMPLYWELIWAHMCILITKIKIS